MHPCAVDHCRHVAEVVPVLEIPFVGRDFAAHVPLRISVPLAHCKRHAREAIPSDFLERRARRTRQALFGRLAAHPDPMASDHGARGSLTARRRGSDPGRRQRSQDLSVKEEGEAMRATTGKAVER